MATNEIFAKALRHYRDLAGMTQERLASAASLDRTYISQLERGHKSPTLNTMAKLAGCLDTTVQRLLHEPVLDSPMVPADYFTRSPKQVAVARMASANKNAAVAVPASSLLTAVNATHALIDDLYSADLEVATIPRIAKSERLRGRTVRGGDTQSERWSAFGQPAPRRLSRPAVDGCTWPLVLQPG